MTERSRAHRLLQRWPWIVLGGAAALALGSLDSTQRSASAAHAEAALQPQPIAVNAITSAAAASTSDDAPTPDYVDRVSAQGQAARGLYFSSDVVAALGAQGVIRVVRNARMNAAVIDLKDE